MRLLKKNSAGVLVVTISVEDAWYKDAERIMGYGEIPVVVQFEWGKAPNNWNPFGSEVARGQILRELNKAFEEAGFPARARTLTRNRLCEITEVSIQDLIMDTHDY